MPATVAGIYEHGRIVLLETPTGVREGRVRVVLIEDEQPKPPPRYLEYGKYKGEGGATLEDFEEAEYHGG